MKELFIHEIRNNLFSGKFVVGFFMMLIAFLISLGMMSQEFDNRMANFNDSLSLSPRELFWNKIFFWQFDNGNFNSSDTITYPMGLVKKPEQLLFFSRGLDTEMRQSVEMVATFPIIDITVKPDQEVNLMKQIFSAPDLLFIMKVLVSLLAILFSYNLIVEERERGTLKLLMVNGVGRASIFGGKFLGGMVSIWIAFSAAFLVYLLCLVLFTPVTLQGETPVRVGIIFLVSLLHIAIFFGIGAAVSVFFRKSAPALIVSLFIWLIVVFALPGLSALLAQQFVHVDSTQKVNRMKLEKAQQMESDYSEAHPEDDNISNTGGYGRRHDAIRNEINAELQKIDDEYQRRKELQAQLTTGLARISPVGSLTYLYSALSGNGLEDVKLYQEDLIRFRDTINRELTSWIQDPEFGRLWMQGGFDIPMELKEPMYELMDMGQRNIFNRLSLADSLSTAWIDFLLLALFAIVPAALTFTRFLVYDPR